MQFEIIIAIARRFGFKPVEASIVCPDLAAALDRLVVADRMLLDQGAAERAICHRIAVYLEQEVNRGRDGADRWNVDCEYNLFGHDFELGLRKRLKRLLANETPEPEHPAGGIPAGSVVFPDIIVHRRGTGQNRLVVEAKVADNATPENVEADLLRLEAFRNIAHYRYASVAFVLIRPGEMMHNNRTLPQCVIFAPC